MMMRKTLIVLAALSLPTPGALADEAPARKAAVIAPEVEARILVYPELAEAGTAPPALKLDLGGAPLTVFLAGEKLDPRPEVHLVSAPGRVELRVAEKAAYLLNLGPSAAAGPVSLTLTLESGRPLVFRLVPTAAGDGADSLVEVRLPDAVRTAECPARLATAADALLSCQERAGRSGVELVAKLIARAPLSAGAAVVRSLGWRDKQHHLFVEVIDVLRLGKRSFARLVVENRDPEGVAWRPGEIRVQTDDPLEPTRLVVQVARSVEAIEAREKMVVVVAYDTPQLPAGTRLRVVLPEVEGKRHLVVDGL